MTRLGLVGAGRWGRNYLRAIPNLRQARLTALASRNPEAASWAPRGCRLVSDWRRLLDLPLDGVVLAVPPAAQPEIAAAALRRGLAVLMEKPVATSAAEAKRLLSLAKRKPSLVLVDHVYLYHPAYAALKVRAAALGKLRLIRTVNGNRGPLRALSPLWDWAPHDLAFCVDLLGAPTRASAERAPRLPTAEAAGDLLRLGFSFKGGARAEMLVGSLLPRRTRRFEFRFERGTLVFDDSGPEPSLTENRKPIPFPNRRPLDRLLERFADAVAQGRRDVSDLELGVSVVEALSRCAASLRR